MIDCEGKGRAFTFSPRGAGKLLTLKGIWVRNGNPSGTLGDIEGSGGAVWASGALLVSNCTFESCSIGLGERTKSGAGGGSIFVHNAPLYAQSCNFLGSRTYGSHSGGSVYVLIDAGSVTVDHGNLLLTLDHCYFFNSSSVGGPQQGGGSVCLDARITANVSVAVAMDNCVFQNSSSDHNYEDHSRGNGGGAVGLFGTARARLHNCNFSDTKAIGGVDGGGGLLVVTRTNFAETLLSNCNFWRCASVCTGTNCGGNRTLTLNEAITGGGGVRVRLGGQSDDASHNSQIVLQNCNFVNTSAIGGGGGGYMFYSQDIVSATSTVVGCSFDGTYATGSYGGGGILFYCYNSALAPQFSVSSSRFVHATGRGGGGGLMVFFGSTATRARMVVEDCTFSNCTSIDDSDSGGGGAMIYHGGTALDCTLVFTDTSFVGCLTKEGSGGAATVLHAAATMDCSTVILSSDFASNTVLGGVGGAVAWTTTVPTTNTSIDIGASSFSDNAGLGTGGGGALSIVFPQNEPENLGFVGDPSGTWIDNNGEQIPLPRNLDEPCARCGLLGKCDQCPAFQDPSASGLLPKNVEFTKVPVLPREHEFRKWNWGVTQNVFTIGDSTFARNTALLSGGVLTVPGGGYGTINRCLFDGNRARTLFGGGIIVGGTVRLDISNSTLRRNSCGQRGCQLYSSSGAGINFTGSVVELGCARSGTCPDGFSTVGSGKVTWGSSTNMTCLPGYELENSSAVYSGRVESWQLKPDFIVTQTGQGGTPVRSNFTTNCPCYFTEFRGTGKSTGFGNSTIYPQMLQSALSYRCRQCAVGLYSLTSPSAGSTHASAICKPCPQGGICNTGGGVIAAPGFWGTASLGGDPTVTFYRCPAEYCCDGSATPCTQPDSCSGNRSGTLCGECSPGHTQALGSSACQRTPECGLRDAVWFVPLSVAAAWAYATYARHAPDGRGTGTWLLAAAQPLLYFYQMVQLLPVRHADVGTALTVVMSLLNMNVHVGGHSVLVCPFPGLTTLGAIELRYAVPGLVVLLLSRWYVCASRRLRSAKDTKVRSAGQLLREFQGALLKTAMLAFSTIMTTTFELLHCIRLDNGNRVLYRSAVHSCGLWQAPFYALAAALLLPIVTALTAAVAVRSQRKHPNLPIGPDMHCCTALLSLPSGIAEKLRAPYRDGCGHWEAVLAMHRLLVVAVHSLVSNSAIATVLQTFIGIAALLAHQACRPFRNDSANRVQAMLLSCIVVVALLNVPQAVLDTNGHDESEEMVNFNDQLGVVEAVLLTVPVVAIVLTMLRMAWRRESTCCVQDASTGNADNATPLLSSTDVDVDEW